MVLHHGLIEMSNCKGVGGVPWTRKAIERGVVGGRRPTKGEEGFG